jgi:hypothetical protein
MVEHASIRQYSQANKGEALLKKVAFAEARGYRFVFLLLQAT